MERALQTATNKHIKQYFLAGDYRKILLNVSTVVVKKWKETENIARPEIETR
jgi:hypothetical protein